MIVDIVPLKIWCKKASIENSRCYL